jgi:autotransporter passenger strand-loop-strand repeat protein
MTTVFVSSGQTSSGLSVGAFDSLIVSGGTALDTTVFSGGIDLIQAGGIGIDTIVSTGGTEFLYSGGVASDTTVSAGGQQIVSGGTSISAAVAAGGVVQTVNSDGVFGIASGATIVNGGSLLDSGRAIDTTISSGGIVTVFASGTAIGTDVAAGGTLVIMPYAMVSGTIAQSGADVISADVLISNGYGTPVLSFGERLSGGTISSGYTETVYSGGSTVGTTIASGGQVYILDGGVTTATAIASGGFVEVQFGGLTVGAIVESGGDQYIASGGTAHQTQVQAGGEVTISGFAELMSLDGAANVRGGTALFTSIGAFGVLSAMFGTVSRTTIGSGGELLVEYDGKAQTTTVESGGVALFLTSAAGDQVTVQAGGTLVAQAGIGAIPGVTSAAGAQVFISTGVIVLDNTVLVSATSGTLSGLVLSSALVEVRSGATTQAFVLSGGEEYVSAGGVDSASQIGDGSYYYYGFAEPPYEAVYDGGRVINDVIDGGSLEIASGGIAQGVTMAAITDGYRAVIGVSSGGVASDSLIQSGNVVEVFAGGVVSDSIISAGGSEEVFSGGFATGTVVSAGGTEFIDASGGSTDIHLLSGGGIELNYFPGGYIYSSYAVSAALDSATDVLTVSARGESTTVQLAGDYTGATFHGLSEEGAVLILAEGTPCYCRGTLILTSSGEVPVEHLRIGDRLITAFGAARPLRWIGRRRYAGRFAAHNRDVLPVIVRAGALGGGLPRRDLQVSPLHAMFIDSVLIPARALVNGCTILQAQSVDRVDYFHLELDTHDIILAEGAASESYVDDDSRGMFHNAAEYRTLYPDAPRAPARFCAQRVEDGPLLETIRARLAGAAAASAPLLGWVEHISHDRIIGWASDGTGAAIRLRIVDNGVTLGELTADTDRGDLAQAGIGDGRHGFVFVVPGGLASDQRHLIQVQRGVDNAELGSSPAVLEAATRPDAGAAPIMTVPRAEGALHGSLDQSNRNGLRGWAFDPHAPDRRVALHILDNGVPIARVLANRYRADLAQADIGDGYCSFDLLFPGGLSPLVRHVIELRSEHNGLNLPGSPVVMEKADSFDAAVQQAIAGAVAALDNQADQDSVLSFLMGQAQRILQQRADAQAQLHPRAVRDHYRRRHALELTHSDHTGCIGRALVIDRSLPTPDRDAGSQAIVSHMQALQRLGYEVSFVAAEQMQPAAPLLTAAGISHCTEPYYASVEDVLRRQSGCFDLIYLHRADIAAAYMALCRRWMQKARIVYAVADLHHLRLARQAEIEQRPELHGRSRRLRRVECTAAWDADAVLTHSPHEAALLRQAVPHADVHVVPWHVPLDPTKVRFAKRHGLGFIANYAHDPNVDAARFLVEEIMPLVWAQDPSIGCRLAGSAMTPAIRALAGPRVTLLGHVPDLAAVFSQVRLTVAPLRYGAGIKGKVLASLAAGIPCASSPIAAEGIGLPPGLIAAGAAPLAALILSLHRSQTANRTASRAGLALIAAANATERIDAALGQVIATAVRRVA